MSFGSEAARGADAAYSSRTMARWPISPGMPASRWQRPVLAASVLALLVCALMAYWLAVLREHRIEFTDRQLQLQTAAVSEHADVVFREADASLRHTLADLRDGRLEPANASGRLRLRVRGDPYVRALSLLDRDGRVLASSSQDRQPRLPPLRGGDPAALDIAALATNGGDDGSAIALSRAVPGVPHGVARVVALIDGRFVADVFSRLAAERDARVGLFTTDGARLGGHLQLQPLEPDAATPALRLQDLLQASRGSTIERGARFAAAQQLDGLPVVVVVARDRQAVMAPWHDYVAGAFVVTALAFGLLALLVGRLEAERQAREQLQARLQRTHRLESLGRLAGGIAHDFNNVLVGIVGFAELLQQQLAPGSPQARRVEQVLRAGERGRSLAARLLAFSRGGSGTAAPVAIAPVVDEAVDLIAATLPPRSTAAARRRQRRRRRARRCDAALRCRDQPVHQCIARDAAWRHAAGACRAAASARGAHAIARDAAGRRAPLHRHRRRRRRHRAGRARASVRTVLHDACRRRRHRPRPRDGAPSGARDARRDRRRSTPGRGSTFTLHFPLVRPMPCTSHRRRADRVRS